MKIRTPQGDRKLPSDQELEKSLRRLCELSGLNPDHLSVVIGGGDKNNYVFKSINGTGIRIVNYRDNNRFALQILIGCKSSTVRAFISYREPSKAALTGAELYQKLLALCKDKNLKTIHLEEQTTDAERETPQNVPQTPPPVLAPVVATTAKAALPAILAESGSMPPEEPNSSKVVDYKRFFNNEDNLHLAVVALTMTFPLDQEFGYDKFAEILKKEVGIDLEPMKMASMAGRFTHRGFMVRKNTASPAIYALTQTAFDYAQRTPGEQGPPPIITKRRIKPEARENGPATPLLPALADADAMQGLSLAAVVARFGELKQSEAEYQRIAGLIAEKSQQLKGLDLGSLKEEHASVKAQAQDLERKLHELRCRMTEIETLGARATTFQSALDALKEQLRAKGLDQKHAQYEAARTQLAQLKELLAA